MPWRSQKPSDMKETSGNSPETGERARLLQPVQTEPTVAESSRLQRAKIEEKIASGTGTIEGTKTILEAAMLKYIKGEKLSKGSTLDNLKGKKSENSILDDEMKERGKTIKKVELLEKVQKSDKAFLSKRLPQDLTEKAEFILDYWRRRKKATRKINVSSREDTDSRKAQRGRGKADLLLVEGSDAETTSPEFWDRQVETREVETGSLQPNQKYDPKYGRMAEEIMDYLKGIKGEKAEKLSKIVQRIVDHSGPLQYTRALEIDPGYLTLDSERRVTYKEGEKTLNSFIRKELHQLLEDLHNQAKRRELLRQATFQQETGIVSPIGPVVLGKGDMPESSRTQDLRLNIGAVPYRDTTDPTATPTSAAPSWAPVGAFNTPLETVPGDFPFPVNPAEERDNHSNRSLGAIPEESDKPRKE